MEIRFKPNSIDYWRFSWHRFGRTHILLRFLAMGYIICTVLFLIYSVSLSIANLIAILITFGIGAAFVGFTLLLQSRRLFNMSEIVYSPVKEGLNVTYNNTTSTLLWALIQDVSEDRNNIYLWRSRMVANIIPKRAFKSAEEKNEFLELINNRSYDTAEAPVDTYQQGSLVLNYLLSPKDAEAAYIYVMWKYHRRHMMISWGIFFTLFLAALLLTVLLWRFNRIGDYIFLIIFPIMMMALMYRIILTPRYNLMLLKRFNAFTERHTITIRPNIIKSTAGKIITTLSKDSIYNVDIHKGNIYIVTRRRNEYHIIPQSVLIDQHGCDYIYHAIQKALNGEDIPAQESGTWPPPPAG